ASNGRALLECCRGLERIRAELLDAKADPFLLWIGLKHNRLHGLALVVVLDRFLARALPIEVRQMDHAVDPAIEADEQAELGDIADLAFDGRAFGMVRREGIPRVF